MRRYLRNEQRVSLFQMRDEQLRERVGIAIGRYHARLFDEVPPIKRIAPESHKEVGIVLVGVAQ